VGGGVERIVPATAVNLGCVEGNEENCDRFFFSREANISNSSLIVEDNNSEAQWKCSRQQFIATGSVRRHCWTDSLHDRFVNVFS